jgi:hypothetical protein
MEKSKSQTGIITQSLKNDNGKQLIFFGNHGRMDTIPKR